MSNYFSKTFGLIKQKNVKTFRIYLKFQVTKKILMLQHKISVHLNWTSEISVNNKGTAKMCCK